MKPVIAFLIVYKIENQQAGGHADGETRDVDERVSLIPDEIPEGDFEIIFKHLVLFYLAHPSLISEWEGGGVVIYSYFKASTGLPEAARQACQIVATMAMTNTNNALSRKYPGVR